LLERFIRHLSDSSLVADWRSNIVDRDNEQECMAGAVTSQQTSLDFTQIRRNETQPNYEYYPSGMRFMWTETRGTQVAQSLPRMWKAIARPL
jgi:hypothetical protein